MILAWLGIALLAGSWLWGLGLWGMGYYHRPDPADWWLAWALWCVLVAAGAVLSAGAVRRLPGRVSSAVAAAMVAPAAVLLPWPYRAGAALVVAGLVVIALPAPRRWVRRLAAGGVAAGAVMVAQGLAVWAYASLTARGHDLPAPLVRLLAWVLGLAGMDAAADGGYLAMYSMRRVHRLAATWELLLDPASLCFLVGGLVLIALRAGTSAGPGRRLRCWAGQAGRFAVAMAVWLPLRAAVLAAVYMHRALRTGYDEPLTLMGQFWSPLVHLVLLAGPVLLAWRVATRPAPPEGETAAEADAGPSRLRRRVLAAGLAFAGVAVLTVAALWNPVGQRKQGRVVFDEHHSRHPWANKDFDTTRSDKPFDTTWFGHASGYNYACIYDYCSRFYAMSHLNQPIDHEILRDCDVLVLKVPSLAFTEDEIALVRRFVEAGGGLLLIGEHTSVFGSGVYLNQIARTFGFAFRDDCLFGIDSVFEERYVPPLVPHPIVQGIGAVDFATSCSIDPGALGGRAVILATGLKSRHADYHAKNAYPQTDDSPEMRCGAFVQLWAARYGDGRVLAFTDSTIFSNFSAFDPGKSELMLGMLEWLNHRGGPARSGLWLALLGAVLLAGAAGAARACGGAWVVVLAAGVLGFAVAVPGVRRLHRAAMPLPEQVRPMVRVAMDLEVSGGKLPRNGFIAGREDGFGLFERSILRLGYFTFRSDGPGLTGGDLVVFLHPNRDVSEAFRSRLVGYVAAGGRVLLLDSPENAGSTANSLLYPFGLSVDRSKVLTGELKVPEGWDAIPVASACPVRGGAPLAKLKGSAAAAAVRHGKGSVTVIGFGSRFSDANMGVTGDVVPDAELRKVYEFQFALLRAILTDSLPAVDAAAQAPSE